MKKQRTHVRKMVGYDYHPTATEPPETYAPLCGVYPDDPLYIAETASFEVDYSRLTCKRCRRMLKAWGEL